MIIFEYIILITNILIVLRLCFFSKGSTEFIVGFMFWTKSKLDNKRFNIKQLRCL